MRKLWSLSLCIKCHFCSSFMVRESYEAFSCLFVQQMKDMLKLWNLLNFWFVFHNIWKICWSCEAFSICIFFFHNIWKMCWTCEAFYFCLFVFQNISNLCGSRLFLFFISSSRKFTVDTGSGAAASKLPQPKIFPIQIGCGGKIFDQEKKYLT